MELLRFDTFRLNLFLQLFVMKNCFSLLASPIFLPVFLIHVEFCLDLQFIQIAALFLPEKVTCV